jgi:hypothetical protein
MGRGRGEEQEEKYRSYHTEKCVYFRAMLIETQLKENTLEHQ